MTTTENVTRDKMRDLQTQFKKLRLNKAKVISCNSYAVSQFTT